MIQNGKMGCTNNQELMELSSNRCPLGSRVKQRSSEPLRIGGVRKVAPRRTNSSWALEGRKHAELARGPLNATLVTHAWASSTRIVQSTSRVSGSVGGLSVTEGLSGVGPPSSTRRNQASSHLSTIVVPYSRYTSAAGNGAGGFVGVRRATSVPAHGHVPPMMSRYQGRLAGTSLHTMMLVMAEAPGIALLAAASAPLSDAILASVADLQ